MPNINTKFTLSGEKEYKQAISEIGSGMKVLDSEMRKVSSAYAQNADSVEALNAKNDVLERKISTQAEKIESLQVHQKYRRRNLNSYVYIFIFCNRIER